MIVLYGPLAASEVPGSVEVIYPGVNRSNYPIEVLRLALSYPSAKYKLVPHGQGLPRGRVFSLLTEGREIDVLWGGATLKRESAFLPIRFPLYKGLMGWRIALVNKERAGLFDGIETLEDFKALVPGQHHSWSDTKILTANGIEVFKASNIEGLFKMLSGGRFDYFPRSVIEIWGEMESRPDMDILIEPSALIHYPTAYYFYVNKNNLALASIIENGLEAALANGEFEKLFQRHAGEVLKRVRSNKRRIYSLENPLLSNKTPLHRSELWLSPEEISGSNLK